MFLGFITSSGDATPQIRAIFPRRYPPPSTVSFFPMHMSSTLQLVWFVAFALRSAYSEDTSWNLLRNAKVEATSGFVSPAADRPPRPVVSWTSKSPRIARR